MKKTFPEMSQADECFNLVLLGEKIKARKNLAFVELLGFEPRQTEPKSVVLPLHHSSIRKECKNKGMAMMYQIFLLPAQRPMAAGR